MKKIDKSQEQDNQRDDRRNSRWEMIADGVAIAQQNQINFGHLDQWMLVIPSLDDVNLRFLNLGLIEGKTFEETRELTNSTFLRLVDEKGVDAAANYASASYRAIDEGTLPKETSSQELSERIWFILNYFRYLSAKSPIEFYEEYRDNRIVFIAIKPTKQSSLIE